MRRHRGGLYIGPWTLRLIVGTFGAALTALFIFQLPDLRRYIKFETM